MIATQLGLAAKAGVLCRPRVASGMSGAQQNVCSREILGGDAD
jgi:hypothetical protein